VVVWAGPALAAGLLPHHLRARRSHPSWRRPRPSRRGHGGGPDLSRRQLLRTLPLHGGDMRGTRDSGRCAATTAILAAPDGPRVGNPRRRWHRSSRKGPAAAAAVPSADPPCAAHATPVAAAAAVSSADPPCAAHATTAIPAAPDSPCATRAAGATGAAAQGRRWSRGGAPFPAATLPRCGGAELPIPSLASPPFPHPAFGATGRCVSVEQRRQ